MIVKNRKWRAVVLGTMLLGSGLVTTQAHAQASEPFIGQLAYVGFNFAPQNWASCDGQLLSISSNTALFSLLGTLYGGDGRTTFALPDMRGRVPIHAGQGPGLPFYSEGQRGGATSVTLNIDNLPAHSHTATTDVTLDLTARASTATATTNSPQTTALADTGREDTYSTTAPNVDMAPGTVTGTATAVTTVGDTGNGQAFSIMPPYLVVRCIIALQGIFPPRN